MEPKTTISLPFSPEDVRRGTTLRGMQFDRAWKAIVADPELEKARRKLSIHEIRILINHVLDAA